LGARGDDTGGAFRDPGGMTSFGSRKTVFPLIAIAVLLVTVASACGGSSSSSSSNSGGGGGGKVEVCVLLPDTKSSVRYELFDRPYLAANFKAAGVKSLILNALGDQNTQKSQGDQCLTNGAKVILVDALNSGVGAAIENEAASRGAKTIDYDRLVLHGKSSYYVSFNNVAVGRLQGQGVVAGLKADGKYSQKPVVAELNGAPTDNNAKLFKQGYDSVLDPLYQNGTFSKGPDQSVPDWDNQKALTIFEQMLARTNNKIDAVAAANDGLAGAVVSALKNRGLKPIPLSGQDATPQGVQNILSGNQTMTVYKAVKTEAAAAAKVAVALLRGQNVETNGSVNNGDRNVPSVLLKPVSITKQNYTLLFRDGFLKRSQVCVGQYAKFCAQ
jgi:D-xylose transport system substrate-binding protein